MNILLHIAVGDSYGAGLEYRPIGEVHKHNNLLGYHQHQKHKDLVPGHYTDDGHMAISIAQHMLEDDVWNHMALANRFIRRFKQDPRKGFAGGFYDLQSSVKDGAELLQRIHPDSDKSGGAMRAGVIGLYPDVFKVIDVATLQASVTHATYNGMLAAAAAALMTHYFYYRQGSKNNVGEYLTNLIPHRQDANFWHTEWQGPVGAPGLQSVLAALTAIRLSPTIDSCLKRCIAFTGDVDTVAAIAMGPASVCNEMEGRLPKPLIDGFERGPFGYDFINDLDRKLAHKFPRG